MINTYPRSYYEARKAFREAALRVGAKIQDHVVLAGQQRLDDLSIDVAVIGSANPEWSVVVSTGLHGIEGFFGSAVQITYLQDLIDRKSLDKRNGELVFLHSLNPFGFAMLRRVNEENVDLNRNFLLPSRSYRGAPDAYAKLNDFLNPQAPPRRVDFYLAKVLWKIGRVGLPALKQAIAGGQYKFPKGIFFGGHAPSRSAQIVQSNMLRWIRGRHVVHLDFHTGLGKYSTYKLLVTVPLGAEMQLQYRKLFGSQVEFAAGSPGPDSPSVSAGIAYKTVGDLGQYMTATAKDRDYYFLFAEFGSYSAIRILGALRRENQAHFFTPEGSASRKHSKAELLECFCPASPSWRNSVVSQSIEIIQRAEDAAFEIASTKR